MGKVLMISDTHLFQEDIRKFSGINSKETDEAIIQSLKTCMNEDDVLWHLGDVGEGEGRLWNLFDSLPGHKILIMGNHDTIYTPDQWRKIGFNEVYQYPIIYEQFYMLSHKPQYITQYMPYVNIHGHIHANVLSTPGKVNQYVNVSWDNLWEGKPKDFEKDIKSIFMK